jgi:hypothetical protein
MEEQRTKSEEGASSSLPLNQNFNAPQNQGKTNLIVNYLPQAMNDKELQCMFLTIGPLKSCKVMKDTKVRHLSPITWLLEFWNELVILPDEI